MLFNTAQGNRKLRWAIHSTDEVAAGKKIIDEVDTAQDG